MRMNNKKIYNLKKNLPLQRFIKGRKERYSVVDSKGKVIQKFRYKLAAISFVNDTRENYYEKLEIVEIEE